ncbi:hypothetical protein DsansV1_C11g0114121 [Dioscorea sansibarensis]
MSVFWAHHSLLTGSQMIASMRCNGNDDDTFYTMHRGMVPCHGMMVSLDIFVLLHSMRKSSTILPSNCVHWRANVCS